MVLLDHLNTFRMICYIPFKLRCTPLEFHHNSAVMQAKDTSLVNVNRNLYIQFLIYILVPLQGIQCFYLNPQNYNLTYFNKITYGLVLVGLCAAINNQISCVRKWSLQCCYVNGVVQLSKLTKKVSGSKSSPSTLITKLDLAFAKTLTPNIAAYPVFFVFGLHWLSPCKPSLAGYFIIPECTTNFQSGYENSLSNILVKFVICLMNSWSWTAGLFCAGFCTAGIVVLCNLSFGDFLLAFEELSKSVKKEDVFN